MSTYKEALRNPVEAVINKGTKEVIFNIVSCMCDNKHTIKVKKNEQGEFKVTAGRFSLSNFQMEGDYRNDIEWYADEGNWGAVAKVINSGTSAIESVRQR